MFFKQNQEQIKQVQEYHKKLVSTQYLLTAISLADSLQGSLREDEVKRIILNLLYLSNELHGSKSPHLLGQATPVVDGAVLVTRNPKPPGVDIEASEK